ncbi:MAG: polysaccharide pyruvyl transferase family protein [Melioribacteraceae bacterium]|nr:polysaccharide pyruvyl transferase family protein [Melioribacteraceae bacterium]
MKIKDLFKNGKKIGLITNGRSQKKIDRESIIIHHYCPHTFNVGDHFVIRSIRKYLKQELPESVFVPFASAGNRGWGKPTRLQSANINKSNKYADAVIVGGSDQYNNWDLRINKDEITKLVPPLYLIGLGASSKNINEPPFIKHDSYWEDIKVSHQTARFSSVRDLFTQKFLEKAGYNKSIVTGCPALHLFNEELHLNKSGYVALTFPFPVISNRNRDLYSGLIKKIKVLIKNLKDDNLKPVIACHDDRDVFVAQENFPEEKIFFSNYVDEFIDFYRSASIVIGSRLHASIFTAGLGKPFININIDFRGQAFSNTFGLENWNINIDDDTFDSKLKTRYDMILSDDLSEFDNFLKLKSKYRAVYLEFMKKVAQDIKEQLAR